MISAPEDQRKQRIFFEALFHLAAERGGAGDVLRRQLASERVVLDKKMMDCTDILSIGKHMGAVKLLDQLEEWIENSRDIIERMDKTSVDGRGTIP